MNFPLKEPHDGSKFETFNLDSFHLNLNYDFILTDPPYELDSSGGGGIVKEREFINELCESDIVDGYDVSKYLDKFKVGFNDKFNGVFFCSKSQLYDYINYCIRNSYFYTIGVWHKTNPAPLCGGKYLNDIEFWIHIKEAGAKIYGEYKTKSLVYTSQVNKVDKKLYEHPTVKPVELMKKFIINHTLSNEIVYDPFMGTGTTGVASLELNRKFIGVEINQKYFDTANKRLNEVSSYDWF